MTTYQQPLKPATQQRSWNNQEAFERAMDETYPDTQEVIEAWIETIANVIMARGNIASLITAKNQAAAVIASLVFDGKYDHLLTATVKGLTK
jgi:hypothetical protein